MSYLQSINEKRYAFDRTGCSRVVILTKNYAFKLPNFLGFSGYRWKAFLQGLLANLQEVCFWTKGGYPELCPIRFRLPLGLLVVMPRAEILSDDEFSVWDVREFCNKKDYCIPAEEKANSFGRLPSGQIVCIDYGN